MGLFPVILVQHLLGVSSAVLCYLIARRLFSPHRLIAIASGLLAGMVVYPALIEQSVLSESLFSFLLLAAAYLSLAWFQEARDWAALGCGLLLGLAALTRPIAAGVLPLWAGLFFVLPGVKRAGRFLLLGGGAFLMTLLPLLLRNHSAMGTFALTESLGRNLISVTDPLVDYDRGVQLPVKAIYREFLKDKRGPDAVVIYSAMPRLRSATHWTDLQIDRALAAIAWEAIREHPFEYLAGRIRRLPLLFRDPGASQWYALHRETYLPFLEFIGRLDPELVSRSVALPSLQHTGFGLAGWTFRVFAMDLTSGWLMVFPLFGMAAVLLWERQRGAWMLIALVTYLWVGAVLLQPPNGRYRIPTLALEVLFAVAGWRAAAQVLAGIAKKIWRPSRGARESAAMARSPRTILAGTLIAISAILAVRGVLEMETDPVLNIAEWRKKWSPASESQALQFRDVPVAGQNLPVLYWNGGAALTPETVSAEIPITEGLTYGMQAAFSCALRDCSGAMLRLTFLDSAGSVLNSERAVSQSLAQERSDNDLFWDQIDRRFQAPRGARTMRLELTIRNGPGNLVIPYLSVRREPSLFHL